MENIILDVIKACVDDGELDLAMQVLSEAELSEENRMKALEEIQGGIK
jgi:hypothetical protein